MHIPDRKLNTKGSWVVHTDIPTGTYMLLCSWLDIYCQTPHVCLRCQQKRHLTISLCTFEGCKRFAQRSLPQVDAARARGQSSRYGEQGAESTVDFIGLVAVAASRASLAMGNLQGPQCQQHTHTWIHLSLQC